MDNLGYLMGNLGYYLDNLEDNILYINIYIESVVALGNTLSN